MSEPLAISPFQLIDAGIKISPYFGALILAIYVLGRTNALFYIVYRGHQILGGAKDFHSKSAQRHWKAHEDFQRFNLWFGMNLRTSRNMTKFLSWLDHHELTIEELCRARRYFNANKLEFAIPTPWHRWTMRASILAGIAILTEVWAVFVDARLAFYTVNKTKTSFWVEENQARSSTGKALDWLSESWIIDTEYCLFSTDTAPLANEWDKEVICDLVLGNQNPQIEEAVKSQRFIAVSAGILGAAWFIFLLFIVDRERNAKALLQKVDKNNTEPTL